MEPERQRLGQAPVGDPDGKAAAERRARIEAMVRGAVLPALLDRKDRGALSRAPNVVPFQPPERDAE